MPIPSFLLSQHVNLDSLPTPASATFNDPLSSHNHHASASTSQPPPQPNSQPASSASSIHSQTAALAPALPADASTPTPASTAVKRKAPSAIPSDHNAIERKYRDNINDGFTRLRDSVPVLRVLLWVHFLFPPLFLFSGARLTVRLVLVVFAAKRRLQRRKRLIHPRL